MITQNRSEYQTTWDDNSIKTEADLLLSKLEALHGKLEEELTLDDIEGLNPNKRGYPNYMKGTFDEYGIPTNKVLKEAYNNIVLGLSRINVLEGGVRAGKDVVGIAIFSELIMLHPAKKFGVLGVSLEHAVQTVFQSDGFGIFYTIPHGRLTRENIDGAQRVVYKFINYWGIEKQIVIYGNSNKNDWEKYHGFSTGAWYINEGINQEVRGIEEADQRMIQSPMPVMVITQNPEGPMNPFYKQFEAPRLPQQGIINEIEELQELSKTVLVPIRTKDNDGKEVIKEVIGFKEYEDYYYSLMKQYLKNERKSFLIKKERPDLQSLDIESQIQWNAIEQRIRYLYEKNLRGVLVRDIFDGLAPNHPLAKVSWKKLVYFKKAYQNPNDIENNVDYSYYHVTMEDNDTLTEEQKSMAEKGYSRGSALYLQKIKGVRKAVDSAVWGTFTEKNVFNNDINIFKEMPTTRVIVIDFGAGKASGIADYEIDFTTGDLWQTREKHITPEYAKSIGTEITDDLIWEEYLKILKDGKKKAHVIIDTANAHLRNYFTIRGVQSKSADKRYEVRKGKDTQRTFEGVDVDLIGLELVNLGFDLNKIHIHTTCKESQKEIASYEYDKENDKTGKVNVIKVADEFCDTLRYVVSTMLGGPMYWFKGGEKIERTTELLHDDENKKTKEQVGSIQAQIQRRIAERGKQRFFERRGNGQYGRKSVDELISNKQRSGFFSKYKT